MEVTVLEASNAPTRPMLAVRAGDLRRQVRMEVANSFQLPVPSEGATSSVEVALFQHLASHAFPSDDSRKEVLCSMPVRRPDGSGTEVKLRVRRRDAAGAEQNDKASALAADAEASKQEEREYMERHQLERRVQELIQEVLKEQPCDPYRHMQERLKKQRDGAATAAAASGSEAASGAAASGADALPLLPRPPAEPAPSAVSPKRVSTAKAAAAATGGGRQGAEASDIGGFYVDQRHFVKGTLAGTRMVSSTPGEGEQGAKITLVGSDDGSSFWTLFGNFVDRQGPDLIIDFSPTGGPKDLRGRFESGRIAFDEGNFWTKVHELDSSPSSDASTPEKSGPAFGGLYTDPHHFKKGGVAGIRMISDSRGSAPSDDITLVGSDDGLRFWALTGRFTSKKDGSLEVDFSPKGGPAKLTATWADGLIRYEDGNAWAQRPLPATAVATEGA